MSHKLRIFSRKEILLLNNNNLENPINRPKSESYVWLRCKLLGRWPLHIFGFNLQIN